MITKIILIIFSFILIYGIVILLSSISFNNDNADYAIVLGHKLNDDKPTKVLIYRLNKTIDYLNKNKNCKVVLSGGVTENNTISEASVMKKYLINSAIAENRIILEDKSKDTIENIKNCKEYINKNNKIVIISSNYHILRSKMICRLLGLNVTGLACYTPIIDLIKHIPIEEVFIFIHYFRLKRKQDA